MRWIIFSLVFLLAPISSYANNRIGFIDLRKALNGVNDGRIAKDKLRKKKKRYQKELTRLQKALKKEKKKYDVRAAILTSKAKRRWQLKLQKKFITLQRKYTLLTRTLAREESIETRKIFRKMEVIIRGIARENKLILMLEKTESSVLYALPDMNYTNELIRRYNRIYNSKGKKRRKKRRRRRRRRRRRHRRR